jgi:hypothetical protein
MFSAILILRFHDYEKPAQKYSMWRNPSFTSNARLHQSGSVAYALICGNRECECMEPHRLHQYQLLSGLRVKLHTPPALHE